MKYVKLQNIKKGKKSKTKKTKKFNEFLLIMNLILLENVNFITMIMNIITFNKTTSYYEKQIREKQNGMKSFTQYNKVI